MQNLLKFAEGRYDLQYACSGAELNVYADAVCTSEHPLGTFTRSKLKTSANTLAQRHEYYREACYTGKPPCNIF